MSPASEASTLEALLVVWSFRSVMVFSIFCEQGDNSIDYRRIKYMRRTHLRALKAS